MCQWVGCALRKAGIGYVFPGSSGNRVSAAKPWRISRLGPGDVELARAMNALFAEVFEDPAHYAAAPPNESYLSGLLTNTGAIALVAVANSEVVGALTAYSLPKFEQARSEIYIYDLAVAVAWQRQGIATDLIAAVQEIARETDAWVTFVQADYGDEPAIALYTKLGTREDVMHFDLNQSHEANSKGFRKFSFELGATPSNQTGWHSSDFRTQSTCDLELSSGVPAPLWPV
jgi:aminoglycoside 3-N-acetyltransferase I